MPNYDFWFVNERLTYFISIVAKYMSATILLFGLSIELHQRQRIDFLSISIQSTILLAALVLIACVFVFFAYSVVRWFLFGRARKWINKATIRECLKLFGVSFALHGTVFFLFGGSAYIILKFAGLSTMAVYLTLGILTLVIWKLDDIVSDWIIAQWDAKLPAID